MKLIHSFLSTLSLLLVSGSIQAQTPSGADYIKAYKKANCTIPFDINAEGEPFRIKWGMDTAWDWDWNVTRGVNYYKKGLFETGRISFQPNDLVTDNGDGTYTLSARQQKELKWRCDLIKRTGTTEVNINCDHEALFKSDGKDDLTGVNNYQGKPQEWYKLIKASVQYAQKQGLKVVSVSPFNESDFGWSQYKNGTSNVSNTNQQRYGMPDFLAIAKLIKEDSFFDGIRVCGGNTLNCDRALPWYNYLKDYLDEGNTHQLAGSFDTYAEFFTQVKADGKVATADELHNVGEAIVGANYGMETGIWWGFDSKARGQFMHDSNEGVRLGYGENRGAWTCGAVYRNDETGEIHGFLGSSERQANNSSFAFVSETKDVFYNGEGPTRMFVYDVPGGTGYQNGQINAERVFDVTWGEDVAQSPINGEYMIFNASTKKMLTWNAQNNVTATSLASSGTKQHWKVYPSYTDGDISYWFIDNVSTSSTKVNLNVLNNNLNANAGVICWDAGHGAVEQWYLKYVKDGYYYIISRLSNKYLHCNNGTITLQNEPASLTTEATLKKYLWRFQPLDSDADVTAPSAPDAVQATVQNNCIRLEWTAVEEENIVYNILRAENGEWNTIARSIVGNEYIDNNTIADHQYTYKVVAVDYAGNRSEASAETEVTLTENAGLVMQLQFDKDLKDKTKNCMNAAINNAASEKYSSTTLLAKSGTNSLNMSNQDAFLVIPSGATNTNAMTIATWVRWTGTGSWQRIFDFGTGTDKYMFLTPSNGSEMRFVMKNGGDEEILSGGKLASNVWKHIAITINPTDAGVEVKFYIDGEEKAASTSFTIKPSDIGSFLNYIGRSQYSSDPLFKGYLDDFRIYNYALTAEAVKAIMEDVGEESKDLDTAIESVKDNQSLTTPSADYYDMSGRKISKPSKGIYINEGKKVMVK